MVTVAIPARLESTRLSRKLLAEVAGKAVLRHAWEGASELDSVDDVFILTDSDEISSAARSWGASVIETGSDFRNGTERIASVSDHFTSELIINVQGDQVGLKGDILTELVETWANHREKVITPVFSLSEPRELQNPDLVKVVKDQSGRAIYFSRAAVPPHQRGDTSGSDPIDAHFGHIGIYGFAPNLLEAYARLPVSENELAQGLEQLRFIDNGIAIQTFVTAHRPIAINSAADLRWAREEMGSR